MTIREKAKLNQLEARLKKAKEERDKMEEVIRNIQSQINTINQVSMIWNAHDVKLSRQIAINYALIA